MHLPCDNTDRHCYQKSVSINGVSLDFRHKFLGSCYNINPHMNIEKKLAFLNMLGLCGLQEGYRCDIEVVYNWGLVGPVFIQGTSNNICLNKW